mmetsp:Transcript_5716/g.21628  ORF Transcript_5716/g.21628 Transcript_5716/m.21628 type:complete len:106 (+) Transcript_5716:908-1225(+)
MCCSYLQDYRLSECSLFFRLEFSLPSAMICSQSMSTHSKIEHISGRSVNTQQCPPGVLCVSQSSNLRCQSSWYARNPLTHLAWNEYQSKPKHNTLCHHHHPIPFT